MPFLQIGFPIMGSVFVFFVLISSFGVRASLNVDHSLSQFLSDLHTNDQSAAHFLDVDFQHSKKSFLATLPEVAEERSYAEFDRFILNHNFSEYFRFVQNTELFAQTQKEIAIRFNIPHDAQRKLFADLWEDYFSNHGNQIPNWYYFYQQEKKGSLILERIVDQDGVFAIWFRNRNDKSLKKSFFSGTSPEFDLIAFTLCALQTSHEHPMTKCGFELSHRSVTAIVMTRRVGDDQRVRLREPFVDYDRMPVQIVRADARGYGRPTAESADQADFQGFVDSLWAADEDRAPSDFVDLDWQQRIDHGGSGRPLRGLFAFVNETLFERPLYLSLLKIYNKKLFQSSVCEAEKPMEGERKAIIHEFFDLVTQSRCFQLAFDYLKERGFVKTDLDHFLDDLFILWFGTYSRCKGPLGSSGFEHVFLGERRGDIVDGQHNWIRYYLLEKSGQITYYGYFGYDDDFIGTIRYKWQSAAKEKGGFFIRTSPAFDFALFTVCVYSQSGSQHCRFKVNEHQLFVTSYQQKCDEGHCLSTSYPGITNAAP